MQVVSDVVYPWIFIFLNLFLAFFYFRATVLTFALKEATYTPQRSESASLNKRTHWEWCINAKHEKNIFLL